MRPRFFNHSRVKWVETEEHQIFISFYLIGTIYRNRTTLLPQFRRKSVVFCFWVFLFCTLLIIIPFTLEHGQWYTNTTKLFCIYNFILYVIYMQNKKWQFERNVCKHTNFSPIYNNHIVQALRNLFNNFKEICISDTANKVRRKKSLQTLLIFNNVACKHFNRSYI